MVLTLCWCGAPDGQRLPSVEKGLAELIVLEKRQLGAVGGTARRVVCIGQSHRDFAGQSGRSPGSSLVSAADRFHQSAATSAVQSSRPAALVYAQ
jgi:hypothetical protein